MLEPTPLRFPRRNGFLFKVHVPCLAGPERWFASLLHDKIRQNPEAFDGLTDSMRDFLQVFPGSL